MEKRDLIVAGFQSGDIGLTSKIIVNMAKYPEIDRAVLQWFNEMRQPSFRCKPMPLSRSHIQARALSEAKRLNLNEFVASDGWFQNWRKKHGIGKSVRLYGEAGDVSVQDFVEAMNELKEKLELEGYKLENIFNMDETGLFFRAMPVRTYLATVENRKTTRGTKALKAKDRVTLIICVNATGINKMNHFIYK